MAQSFDCPSCGAPVQYDSRRDGETIRCPFCNESIIVPAELRPPQPQAVYPPSRPPTAYPPSQPMPVYPVSQPMPVYKADDPMKRIIGCIVIFVVVVTLGSFLIPLLAMIPFFSIFTSWPFTGSSNQNGGDIMSQVGTAISQLGNLSANPTQTREATARYGAPTAVPISTATTAPTQAPPTQAVSPTPEENTAATRVVLQSTLSVQKGWQVVFSEDFTKNTRNWTTGDVRDKYFSGNRQISVGKYVWNATAKQSMGSFSYPDMPALGDFMVGVDVLMVKMPEGSGNVAGLMFRNTDSKNAWYIFTIDNMGNYSFSLYSDGNWDDLISSTPSSAIRQGKVNRLEVSGQGSQFIFAINGQVVDYFQDDSLTEGACGVGIMLGNAGDVAQVEFSNFEVRSPKK